ncbi:hypothetical protein BU17DRAFT_84911 [Hysterangium stoloniferum]|nr:hypothetical protein BU17DRAFT_84911 [Hysterangium stoloniferum]
MESILLCQRVSGPALRQVMEESSAIQYKIELAAHGLVPRPACTIPTATALGRLKDQQGGWRRCQWKGESVIRIHGDCRTYELRNGVWAFGHCDSPTQDPANFPPDYTTTITCYQLPSTVGGKYSKEIHSWSLDNFGMSIRDFTMDPAIDLLAIIEQTAVESIKPFRLHFRRLSNGKAHPGAVKNPIDLDVTSRDLTICSFGVQLQASHVGVLVRHDGSLEEHDYFAIWNWQTGSLEMSRTADECSYEDFAFIDKTSAMLAVFDNIVTLEIWRFGGSESCFTGGFEMPLTTTLNAYLDMRFDGGATGSAGGARTGDGTPYSLAPETDILSVTFGVIDIDEVLERTHVASFTMVMRPSLMLKKLAESIISFTGDPTNETGEPLALQWREWGPWCTRWICQEMENVNWEPSAAGGRFVVVARSRAAGDPDDQVIRIFDFRRGVVSRCGRLPSESPSEEFHSGESCIAKDTMFVEDISSSLPYHVVESTRLPYMMSGIMIDEGRLICTKAEEDGEWRSLLVLTF